MPGWPTLVEQIKLADATPVIVRTHAEDGFRLRAEPVLAAVHRAHPRHRHQLAVQSDRRADQRGRSGARSPTKRRSRGIWILLDLCYERLIYDPVAAQPAGRAGVENARPHRSVRLGLEGLRDDRLALRLGGRAGGSRQRLATRLQSHSTSNVCSITQKAVTAALDRPAGLRHRHARRVSRAPRPAARVDRGGAAASRRRNRPVRSTSSSTSPTSSRRTASGRPRNLPRRSSIESRVAITPGEAFDAPGFLRISYATSLAGTPTRGVDRIISFVRSVDQRPREVAGA